MDYEIVVPTSAYFHWELVPFLRLFKRFWGEYRITLLSDQPPLKSDTWRIVDIRYVPVRPKVKELWGNQFSSALYDFLQHDCRTEFLIILMADYWLTAPVQLELLQAAVDYMAIHPNIIRLQISNGMDFVSELIDTYHGLEIRDTKQFLRGSLIPGIWSKKLLLDLLPPNQNLWSAETELTQIIDNTPGIKSLLTAPVIFYYQNVIQTRLKRADFRLFPPELIKKLLPLLPPDFHITLPAQDPKKFDPTWEDHIVCGPVTIIPSSE